jgi:hypothetical protein
VVEVQNSGTCAVSISEESDVITCVTMVPIRSFSNFGFLVSTCVFFDVAVVELVTINND